MSKDNNYCLSAPICVGIITTNRCNLRCKHCMNLAGDQNETELSTSEIKKIIDECANNRIQYVEFNGGEFFVRDDVEILIDYAIQNNLKVTITTNATLITEEWMSKYSGKIALIRISLDSHISSIHDDFRGVDGAFNQTINTIKKLTIYGFNITVLTTISKSRLDTFEDFLLFLENLKVRGLHTTMLVPAGRAKDLQNEVLSPLQHREFLLKCREYVQKYNFKHLNILEESPQSCLLDMELGKLNKYDGCKCGAGFTEVVVLNDGYVLPCAAFISVREQFKQEELNIKNNSLVWIYKNAKLMNDVREVNMFMGKCQKCELLNKCGGGCRIAALLSTNTIYGADPFCWKE